ncbi:TonB-dependent receptor family protein [Enterovirga rhinocerotis]|uniref:Iron complex outermembrane receptor protein n=1 Tax=Enterovirga rhinocerotis TaxID=1339210 RepID=A0A4V3DXC7_9HYPH|nr:iron complex outermembrane receptor protein [Enterovirga rhinocerotis]
MPASGSAQLDPRAGSPPVEGAGAAGQSPFAQQTARFLRRPGAETVVGLRNAEAGRRTNIGDTLVRTPGIFMSERGAGTSGFISIRGSDISIDGSRNGRGIRGYLDGFPLGRTEAGLTNTLIDPLAADFIEVYRGANSLRYGSIATGGALNFVSKTGRTAPGNAVTISGGSFGTLQSQLETGGAKGGVDWYVQANGLGVDGFQRHTRERNYRLSANVGVEIAPGVENRTFFGIGRSLQDMAEPLPLASLRSLRKTAPANSYLFDERINFDYQRIANKTTIRDGSTAYELGFYFLNTTLDHLPSPFAGIIDYGWRDMGVSGRVEHKTELAGLPTEIVAGVRANYTDADFNRYQHRNDGRDKGRQIVRNGFSSWLIESYGEAAIEVMPGWKAFLGLQGVYTTRVLDDHYHGGVVPALGPTSPGGPQPGRSAARQEYDRDFSALNPKIGFNWEHTSGHFLFGNIARSYEVPSGADLSDAMSVQARTSRTMPLLQAQSAWTGEVGVRGGGARFTYDVTFYEMHLDREILTRCATEIDPSCATTVAFNAKSTIHRGIEIGIGAVPFVDVFTPDDKVFVNAVYNVNDFAFDKDPLFGDRRLPVIPRHQVFAEIGYRHPLGYFVSVNVRGLSSRRTTFNGAGGEAFTVPAYALLGAKAGWTAPDKSWSVFVEGRNLLDEPYVSEFSATPGIPVVQQGPRAVPRTTPQVRPGDGRAVYAGVTHRF